MQVNLVSSPATGLTREDIPLIPDEIAAPMRQASVAGKVLK